MHISVIAIQLFVYIHDFLEFFIALVLSIDGIDSAHDELIEMHVKEEVGLLDDHMLHHIIDSLLDIIVKA